MSDLNASASPAISLDSVLYVESGLRQDKASLVPFAGCQISIGWRAGIRPSAIVRGPGIHTVVQSDPIPGCPDWVGRCNALFHARLAAYRLGAHPGR